jgi:hypothetical protein
MMFCGASPISGATSVSHPTASSITLLCAPLVEFHSLTTSRTTERSA